MDDTAHFITEGKSNLVAAVRIIQQFEAEESAREFHKFFATLNLHEIEGMAYGLAAMIAHIGSKEFYTDDIPEVITELIAEIVEGILMQSLTQPYE